jgi:hypothetical protein
MGSQTVTEIPPKVGHHLDTYLSITIDSLVVYILRSVT